MLQFKLEQQASGIASRGHHTMSQRDAELMLLCARLCRIQQEDVYADEYLDYVESKHEFVAMDGYYRIDSTVVNDNLDEYFALYPRQYMLCTQGEIGMHKRKYREELAMEIAHRNQERSRRLLFKILDQRIGDWWD
jgi:hypothetical protein